MRIPTSVIVMSLLTAVPFGLGLRDTLTRKDVASDDAVSRDEAIAEYERELAREAEAREQQNRKRVERLDSLIGETPAHMGSLFDGIVLGADAGSFQPVSARGRIERASEDGFITVAFSADAIALRSVSVQGSDADDCESLRDKLTVWGPSQGGAWSAPATAA